MMIMIIIKIVLATKKIVIQVYFIKCTYVIVCIRTIYHAQLRLYIKSSLLVGMDARMFLRMSLCVCMYVYNYACMYPYIFVRMRAYKRHVCVCV